MMAGRQESTRQGVLSHAKPVQRRHPGQYRSSLTLRLQAPRRERWPQLKDLKVRFRAKFAYVDGVMPDGDVWPVFRLRYGGSAHYWASPSSTQRVARARLSACFAEHGDGALAQTAKLMSCVMCGAAPSMASMMDVHDRAGGHRRSGVSGNMKLYVVGEMF